jgi:hypothetical protein
MVREIGEAASLPRLDERGLKHTLQVPGLPDRDSVDVLGAGFLGACSEEGNLAPPPTLGQHNEEIRAWLKKEC